MTDYQNLLKLALMEIRKITHEESIAWEKINSEAIHKINNHISKLEGVVFSVSDYLMIKVYKELNLDLYWVRLNMNLLNCEINVLYITVDALKFHPDRYIIKEKEESTPERQQYFAEYISLSHLAGNISHFITAKTDKVQGDIPFKTYLMKDNRTGYIKIGKSKIPKIRERTLQSEVPDCNILIIINSNVETELHELYQDKRVRGEWFRLSDMDIKYIKETYLRNQ